jgi:arabinose-5-phosphate isomerase
MRARPCATCNPRPWRLPNEDPGPMSDFDAIAVGRRVLTAEAEGLVQQTAALDESFARAVDLLCAAQTKAGGGRIVCTGMGKSGHVARKIAATFASTGAPAIFVHPAEASHGDLGMIGPDDVILALSKSGEARELADVLAYAARFSIPLIGITAEPASALGQAAGVVLALAPAPEATAAVNAPTTSTTLQMALGDALAVALLERRGFKPSDFQVFHPGGKLGAMLRTVRDLMHGEDELPVVAADTPMRQALLVMTEKRWGIVGVADRDGRLLGAITDGDLRRHIDGLLDHAAGEVMTPGPKKTVPPQMLASEALALMSDPAPAVTVLFVVEDGKPVGILHVHDILRAGVM